MHHRDKVLIVDDEQAIVELMGLYLKSDYDVIPAYSGQEALDKVKAEKPDIILLDVMMPDMNGYEVCRVLKTSVETQFLPVVMVTALSGKDDRIKGIEVGADEFLGKPVNRLELVTRVKSLLRIKHLQDKVLAERNEAMNYLDIAGFVVFVLDGDMKINLVNRKGNEVLGYDEFELIGHDFVKFLVPEEKCTELQDELTKIISGESEPPEFAEHVVLAKDGKEIPMRWYDVVLMDDDGEITGILRSGEDLSKFE
ncbi:two-component system, cell cycle response regulator [Methanolobus vulcani]|jgi:two-component system cell cycle response regulator|uniref:Two-component system, cell cycle response regulator n=1 Tax=Methanolobus vulcani TaxID=38026 RepID=A0A7Z7FCP8_9EURY|nr:response regulator [Methanolobus vulcani]SDF83133.1 two-component system, cell cycle response regulator [Methanolobus vulcani]